MAKRRLRADGTPSPRGQRTPKPPPTEKQLAELERLTDELPEALRVYRDRDLLSPVRRFRLEEAIRNRTRSLVPVLHGVHDPHNQAAVMRTCEALGLQEFHFIRSARGRSLRVSARVTQNADRWIDVIEHTDFGNAESQFRNRGLALYAAAVEDQAVPLAEMDFTRPLAIFFGNESRGLPESIVEACDGTFVIPLYGLSQSLNVSVAAATTFTWAVEARRRAWGGPGDLSPAEQMELRHRFYETALRGHLPDQDRRALGLVGDKGSNPR
jgi:tRNA (guanosine-2'-O-)-methyltransferase